MFALHSLGPNEVDEFVGVVLPLGHHVDPAALKAELPVYHAEAQNVNELDRDDVKQYTQQVLKFWKQTSKTEMPTWRKAARIIFALSPNSASCERVFSLLEALYTDTQLCTLADHLQAALMLRYNKRDVMIT